MGKWLESISRELAESCAADARNIFARHKAAGTAPPDTEMMAAAFSGVALARALCSRVDALHERIEQLEGCGIKYAGVHQRAMAYSRGSVVTKDGSSWIAIVDRTDRIPGESSDWQLMVRCGRDGRDAGR